MKANALNTSVTKKGGPDLRGFMHADFDSSTKALWTGYYSKPMEARAEGQD